MRHVETDAPDDVRKIRNLRFGCEPGQEIIPFSGVGPSNPEFEAAPARWPYVADKDRAFPPLALYVRAGVAMLRSSNSPSVDRRTPSPPSI